MNQIALVQVGDQLILRASNGFQKGGVKVAEKILEEVGVEDNIYQIFDPNRGALVVKLYGQPITDLFPSDNGKRSRLKITEDHHYNIVIIEVAFYATKIDPRPLEEQTHSFHGERVPVLFVRTRSGIVLVDRFTY